MIIRGNSVFKISKCYSLCYFSCRGLKKDVSIQSLPTAYKPQEVESGWYEWWEENGYFKPKCGGNSYYTLLLPPPNVTGALHLGHALTATIQDVLARWRRMHGDSVLWIPGTDHAGIATQVVVEKHLLKERNVTKFDIGRDSFVDEVWKWKQEKGNQIILQLRKMGSSLDWSRLTFTMDPKPSAAVRNAFIKLFDEGLIYRRNSLVNWSCFLQSSVSDIEVDSIPVCGPTFIDVPGCSNPVQFGVLYYVAYPLHQQDGEIVVATTRPETILGDTAIALNPSDPRRSLLEGKMVWHPLRQCPLPIVFDDAVDPNFGTGALKITPAHDQVDFQVAERHKLDSVQIFDDCGKMLVGNICGKQRYDARGEILNQLQNLGMLRGFKDHDMVVPICSRSGDVVEMMLKPQWFLRCDRAGRRAAEAVENGSLRLYPDNYRRVWQHWLSDIKDWNISRQLWWGHRIPAYLATYDCKQEWFAAGNADEARRKASQKWGVAEDLCTVVPDEDVLDTWFSSALQPSNGVAGETHRLPLSLLETGHDIIFFWVARMVMLSLMLTDQLPFMKVLMHGLICDAHGHKMSKSLGNSVTPEQVVAGSTLAEMAQSLRKAYSSGTLTEQQLKNSLAGQRKLFPDGIPECGTDALRFTLCSQAIQSSNISFDVTTCHTNKLFCNKILQAFRFTLNCLTRIDKVETLDINTAHCNGFDKWILSRLSTTVETLNASLENYQFHVATLALKNFLYSELCDVYIESVKTVLKEGSAEEQKTSVCCLINCLDVGLRLLHPFMPFLTEELYQRLPAPLRKSESIMLAAYPKTDEWSQWKNESNEVIHCKVRNIISALRKLKALYGSKGVRPEVVICCGDEKLSKFLVENDHIVGSLAVASKISITKSLDGPLSDHYVKEVVDDQTVVFSNLPDNTSARLKRLEPVLKKEEKLRKQLEKVHSGLVDPVKSARLSQESRTRMEKTRTTILYELQKIADIKDKLGPVG